MRIVSLIVISMFLATVVMANCSCRRQTTSSSATKPSASKTILCSVFPVYLMTRAVATGSDLKVELMLPSDLGCPHDYVITPQDMTKISDASVMVINGAGLEEFVDQQVQKANPSIQIIDCSADIPLLNLQSPRYNTNNNHNDEEEHGDEHGMGLHHENNPHIFASPRLAARMMRNIADGLSKFDPANEKLYRENADTWQQKLIALADDFAAACKTLRSQKIITEHAVFDYLAADCGLQIVGVIQESPGQEPSAAKMAQIVKMIRSAKAAAVFTEPQYPAKAAKTIAKEAGVPTAVLDPVAGGPEDATMDYYEKVMRENLQTIQQTLGQN